MFAIFDNVCDLNTIVEYRVKISNHYAKKIQYHNFKHWYPTRNIKLSLDDSLVCHIKNWLEIHLNISLTCKDAELQTWPITSQSFLHNHADWRPFIDFNSVLYLNDNFEGGEFFTDSGINIVPRTNRLIFFNGSTTNHGLNVVKDNHRYTLICWWTNTIFGKD